MESDSPLEMMLMADQPPGFRGLDPYQKIRVYTRHLPHWRQDGATYFVTFRLADALPQAKLTELQNLREHWEHTHPEPRSKADWDEYSREFMRRAEICLDEGHGACYFKQQKWIDDLNERLQHFNGERYHLACSVVMPNHCHAIIRPYEGHELEDLIGAMKSITARHINVATGRQGDLWQQESYDRIIRDMEHLRRIIQYIGRNPSCSGLPIEKWPRWIDPTWSAAGCGFES